MDSIQIGTKEYQVKYFEKGKKCKKGFAYVKDGIAYPYRGKPSEDKKLKPGIYLEPDGSYKFVKYKKGKEVFHKEEISKSTIGLDILDKIKRDKQIILSKDNHDESSSSSETFAPALNDMSDNILVKIIKSELAENQKSFKDHLAPKFKDMQEANNSKRGLQKHNKMSIERFLKWAEVLGFKIEINVIYDNGTKRSYKE